jgi:hypothetical protein
MPNDLHEYEVGEIGVEFQRDGVEGWINCVVDDVNGTRVRLHIKAHVLVELLAELKNRLQPPSQGN